MSQTFTIYDTITCTEAETYITKQIYRIPVGMSAIVDIRIWNVASNSTPFSVSLWTTKTESTTIDLAGAECINYVLPVSDALRVDRLTLAGGDYIYVSAKGSTVNDVLAIQVRGVQ